MFNSRFESIPMETITGRDDRTYTTIYDEVLEPSHHYTQRKKNTEKNVKSLSFIRFAMRWKRSVTNAATATQSDESSNAIDSMNDSQSVHADRYDTWQLNYREAAIYLEEGENNDKLTTHPSDVSSLQYYFFTHSRMFDIFILLASLTSLSLALCEYPGYPILPIGSPTTEIIELILLAIFSIELVLKLQWLGVKHYFRHVRTMLKTIIIIFMAIDAAVYLSLNEDAMRVTRALRPIFLIDCNLMRGSRRFIRQLIQTVPRVCLMFVLVFLIIMVFSVIGFYLFSSIPGFYFFSNLYESAVSLFVLLTFSNFPDVMLPAYNASRWYGLYFIAFIMIEVYIMLNLLFAVVYEQFTLIEQEKIKLLYLHRRKACDLAFRKLVRKSDPTHITMHNFEGLLSYYRPSLSKLDVLLCFKALTASTTSTSSSKMTIDQFYNVYEITKMKWKPKVFEAPWYSRLQSHLMRRILQNLEFIVSSTIFDWSINVILMVDAFMVAFQAYLYPRIDYTIFSTPAIPITFASFYAVEIAARILALGPRFFASSWNIFDLVVVGVMWVALPIQLVYTGASFASACRMLRLFRMMQRSALYRDLLCTVQVLVPRMLNAGAVICCIFYCYAMIGMLWYAEIDFTNCCENTTFEANYQLIPNEIPTQGYYYLLNFNNVLYASMTLFVIMTVNDWFITISAFVKMTGNDWPQIYFLSFYLIMLVVIVMVVSFILDAFVFRIRYSRQDSGGGVVSRIEVWITTIEYDMCKQLDGPSNIYSEGSTRKASRSKANPPTTSLNSHRRTRRASLPSRLRKPRQYGSRISIPDALSDLGAMADNTINVEGAGFGNGSGNGALNFDEFVWYVGERDRSPFDFSIQIMGEQVQEWIAEHRLNRISADQQFDSIAAYYREDDENLFTCIADLYTRIRLRLFPSKQFAIGDLQENGVIQHENPAFSVASITPFEPEDQEQNQSTTDLPTVVIGIADEPIARANSEPAVPSFSWLQPNSVLTNSNAIRSGSSGATNVLVEEDEFEHSNSFERTWSAPVAAEDDSKISQALSADNQSAKTD